MLEADAVRARALEADHVAPVVEHLPLAARSDEQQQRRRRRGVLGGQQRLAHVEGRVRRARGEGDLAVDLASRRRSRVAGPTGAATELARKSPPAKIASWASCGHHEPTISAWFIVRPRHHAGRDAAAGDLLRRPACRSARRTRSRRSARDVQVVEAGVEEALVHLRRVERALLGLGLLGDKIGQHRDSTRDHRLRRQIRLRRCCGGAEVGRAHRAPAALFATPASVRPTPARAPARSRTPAATPRSTTIHHRGHRPSGPSSRPVLRLRVAEIARDEPVGVIAQLLADPDAVRSPCAST